MFAGTGGNFLGALKNLITRRESFSSQETNESSIRQYFLDKYPDMKIAKFSELKDILENVNQIGVNNLQYQIEATDFIIENMCKENVITTEEEFKTIIGLLSEKFQNVEGNLYLVPVTLIKCVNLIDIKALKERENDIHKELSQVCNNLISQENFFSDSEYILKKHASYKSSIVHMLGTDTNNESLYEKMLDTMYAWIVAEKLNDGDKISKLMKDKKFLYYNDANWGAVSLFDLAHLKCLWEYCDMDSKKLCEIFKKYDIAEDMCCWGVTYVDSVFGMMVNNSLEKGEIKINPRLFKILASKKNIETKQEIVYFAKLYFVQLKEEDTGEVDKLKYIEQQLKKIAHYQNIDIGRFKSFCEKNKDAIIKCKTDSEKSDVMKQMVNYINSYQYNNQIGQNDVLNQGQGMLFTNNNNWMNWIFEAFSGQNNNQIPLMGPYGNNNDHRISKE